MERDDPAAATAIRAAIARVQAGDTESFAVVVEAFQREVGIWIAGYCPSGIEPGEIVHQAFIDAFKGIARCRLDADPLPWLCTIARARLVDELRRRKRRRPDQDLIDELAAGEPDEDAARTAQRRLAALKACLAALPEEGAQLFELRYLLGRDLQTISVMLDRSLSAVKSRLHWLRGMLHSCISERLQQSER
jgi:RNA polymerase sigma-70 factor (ECF subfamily)